MNHVGIRGVVLGFVLAFTRLGVAQPSEVFTLSLVPVGGTTVDAGTIVAVEVLLTVTADACAHTPCTVAADCTAAGFPAGTSCVDGDPGPAVVRTCGGDPVNGIRFEGNQVDVPCVLPGGTSGSIHVVVIGSSVCPECVVGGTTDPDDDGLRGPSFGGFPFIFGPGGLGPFAATTCIIATTPAPGALPINVAVGATRYIGTFFYEVSECAAGSFPIFFECTDQGGPLTTCEDDPEVTNTTRFRNDCPVSTSPGAMIRFREVGTTLTVTTGGCCVNGTCLGELNQMCCESKGGTWAAGQNCDAGCTCTTQAQCDDDNDCTTDLCTGGHCQNTNNTNPCDDNRFCTVNDSCVKGQCLGGGDACPGLLCSEALGSCVQCLTGSDCPPDGYDCTDDDCNGSGECEYNNDDSNPCSDGLFCTRTDTCKDGICGGTPRVCLAGTICCEDADACRQCCIDEDCDDQRTCTTDTCLESGVCVHTPVPDPCNCLTNADCNDANPCTDDACVKNDCRFTNNASPCDDELFCTPTDVCSGGACAGSGVRCSSPEAPLCDETNDRCGECLSDQDCDDGDGNTFDSCAQAICVHLPAQMTLSIVPVGGTTVQPGTTVSVEVFVTVDADSCAHVPCATPADCTAAGFPPGTICVDGDPGPALVRTCGGDPINGIRFEANQIDLPCVLPGGVSGSIHIVEGVGGGSTDPDGDGIRGPAADGTTPFLFGGAGLGPYFAGTCGIATTPAPLAPPVNVAVGQTRYLGTFFYEVSECAAGSFLVFLECTDQSGPLTACEGNPEATNTSRFRNDCPVQTGSGELIRFHVVGTTLTVPVGRCCLGESCLGELNAMCCENQGGRWSAGMTCAQSCSCTEAVECDDTNPCTDDTCDAGVCVYVNNVNSCDDGLFCTEVDECSGGVCQGLLRDCPAGAKCNENSDRCECPEASDNGTTERVSVRSDGMQGNGSSFGAVISADGRNVAFTSDASNLAPGGTSVNAVFVHDRFTRETTRVSVSTSGEAALGISEVGSISSDGRFVAFHSIATNLVPEDTTSNEDVFVHDRLTGETTRASQTANGIGGSGGSFYPSLSSDGRFVAFVSSARNLVANDTNGFFDVFVLDRQTRQTTRVSVNSEGDQSNLHSYPPSLSFDGRFVAFESVASNLVPSDTNTRGDIFLHDRQTAETVRVSVSSQGQQGNGTSYRPAISGDGRFVAFYSLSSNLVAGDTNNRIDVFVHDRLTGQTTRASTGTGGEQGNGDSLLPTISADGRFIAFSSWASNWVVGDTNGASDVFVHDRQTGVTSRVSLSSNGDQSNGSGATLDVDGISADGQYVAFQSLASNLVPGDTNGFSDIFVRHVSVPCGNGGLDPATECDDGNECTDDLCVECICQNVPNSGPCDDGLFCTLADQCVDGLCRGEPERCTDPQLPVCAETLDRCVECLFAPHCDDGNSCTTDSCHATERRCEYLNNTNSCNDGLFCTILDRCADASCHGLPRECPPKHGCDEGEDRCICLSNAACDDDNDCTVDECVDGECFHVTDSQATLCDDGLFCTVLDQCADGLCLGESRTCPDPQAPICDEENDRCAGCTRHQDCDDGNVCTTDRCSKVTGTCHHVPNTKPCNDGLFCTKPDVCSDGVCVGTPRRCPIGQVCDEKLDRCGP